jgi:hypothetical protein
MSRIKKFYENRKEYDVINYEDLENVSKLPNSDWKPQEFEEILKKVDSEKTKLKEQSTEEKSKKLSYTYNSNFYKSAFSIKLEKGDKYGYIFKDREFRIYKKDDDGMVDYYIEFYPYGIDYQNKIFECNRMRHLLNLIELCIHKDPNEL